MSNDIQGIGSYHAPLLPQQNHVVPPQVQNNNDQQQQDNSFNPKQQGLRPTLVKRQSTGSLLSNNRRSAISNPTASGETYAADPSKTRAFSVNNLPDPETESKQIQMVAQTLTGAMQQEDRAMDGLIKATMDVNPTP